MAQGRSYSVEDHATIDAAADRFFETTGLPDGKAWIEVYYGPDEPYIVLNIGPEWRDPVPELPERFEGYAIYSEPGRVEFA